MIELFHEVSERCSRYTTEKYSTSFCSAIRLLHHDLRQPIFNIYGFVRFADEIVDSFHGYDKAGLLARFKAETYRALGERISLNPIINSFQMTVNKYRIEPHLIDGFFRSMEFDLNRQEYDELGFSEYIYGSAEVVGLMCLYVFCEGNRDNYEKLVPYARALGAAFQKVNFLRDVKADYQQLNRSYFPGVDFENFTACKKLDIEENIAKDFAMAYEGILQLPLKARFGVYVAYKYYLSLFRKIKKTKPCHIMEQRIRIPNYRKAMILVRAGVKNQLRMIG